MADVDSPTTEPTDPNSILNAGADWRPNLPSSFGSGEFHMTDMLTLAGVDPERRGQ